MRSPSKVKSSLNHAVRRRYFAGQLVADQFPVRQRPLLTFVQPAEPVTEVPVCFKKTMALDASCPSGEKLPVHLPVTSAAKAVMAKTAIKQAHTSIFMQAP